MSDDVSTPEPEPVPAADRPAKRRPPSQSDIHGISSIASRPGVRPVAARPDPADPTAATTAAEPTRDDG